MWYIHATGQKFEYEQYTSEDGLPSMQTYNIIQDSSGLIWVGTENGLVSFDGENFTRYTHPDLVDNDIIEAVLHSDGRIYFRNLNNQICYVEDGVVTYIPYEMGKGTIVRMVSFKNSFYVSYRYAQLGEIKNPRLIYELVKASAENFEFRLTDISVFDLENGRLFNECGKYEYYDLSDSTFILRTSGQNLIDNNGEQYYFIYRNFGTVIDPVDSVFIENFNYNEYQRFVRFDKHTFIINFKGIIYYQQGSGSFISIDDDIVINTVFVDSEMSVWMSTPNRGLLRYPNLFSELRPNQESDEIKKGINDIYEDENGSIYLGTVTSELILIGEGDTSFHKLSKRLKPVQIFEYDNEIYAYDFERCIKVTKEDIHNRISTHYLVNSTKSLLINDSIVYKGMGDRLLVLDYDEVFNSNSHEIISTNDSPWILDLLYDDAAGQIFLGTTKGLFKYKHNEIIPHQNEKLQNLLIATIIKGNQGQMWLGTHEAGVLHIRNDSIITQYSTKNGLLSNRVNNISLYGDELLISTVKGLSIINLKTSAIKTLNEFNFLPANDVLVCKVVNDQYWVGTREKLTIIDKEKVDNFVVMGPKTSLKEVFVNGVSVPYFGNLDLAYSENNIQLNFQNISYKSGKEKLIKYRLPLQDSSWISTADLSIRLPSLIPGKYRVEAKGVNSIGQESEVIGIDFTIDIPWWKKTWTLILGLLLLVGISYVVIIYRSRRVRKDEAMKRNYLNQINKIKDQALQLQMNPHFIFNSLNAIQGFIGTDEEAKAMNYLARFARLIRLIFEHSKGNTITLEEELEFMQLYLNLEKLRFKNKVDFQVNIGQEVEAQKDIIRVPPLLIQPIVENSFKHGLFHKEGKGNLLIQYNLIGEDTLEVIIEDDGIGRQKASAIAKRNSAQKTSSGIQTTRERIEILNFNSSKEYNSIRIEDLYDEEEKAIGTRTIFTLAISGN